MQYLALGTLIDAPLAPPEKEAAMLKASFEMMAKWASGSNPKVKAVLPFADTRTTAYLLDVRSPDELAEVLASLPAWRLSAWEAHPITTPETVLRIITQMERSARGGA